MTTAINYLAEFSSAEEEQQALDQLCDYLVAKGKYKNREAAHKDARQRVSFLERADFFSDDETLAAASEARKSTAALIQGHSLKATLEENAGYLPATEDEAASAATAAPAAETEAAEPVHTGQETGQAEAAPRPVAGKRPITEIFAAIEMDLRTGMSPQQIISKLVDGGLAEDNAEDALAVVLRQRQQKRRARLLAAGTIVLLSVVLFYFAR